MSFQESVNKDKELSYMFRFKRLPFRKTAARHSPQNRQRGRADGVGKLADYQFKQIHNSCSDVAGLDLGWAGRNRGGFGGAA